jgi:hypothetical protein
MAAKAACLGLREVFDIDENAWFGHFALACRSGSRADDPSAAAIVFSDSAFYPS